MICKGSKNTIYLKPLFCFVLYTQPAVPLGLLPLLNLLRVPSFLPSFPLCFLLCFPFLPSSFFGFAALTRAGGKSLGRDQESMQRFSSADKQVPRKGMRWKKEAVFQAATMQGKKGGKNAIKSSMPKMYKSARVCTRIRISLSTTKLYNQMTYS